MPDEWKEGWIVARLPELAEPNIIRVSYRVKNNCYLVMINHLTEPQKWIGHIFDGPLPALRLLCAEAKRRLDIIQQQIVLIEGGDPDAT